MEEILHDIQDVIHLDSPPAFQIVRTTREEARGTVDGIPENSSDAEGTGPSWLRGAEEGHRRAAGRLGEVKRPRVIGDGNPAKRENRRRLSQRERSHNIHRTLLFRLFLQPF
jgi:hypothetical protein